MTKRKKQRPQKWIEIDHRIAISNYLAYLQARGIAATSRTNYEQRLLIWHNYCRGIMPFADSLRVGEDAALDTSMFHRLAETWLNQLVTHNTSPRTRQLYYSTLRSFSLWLKKMNYIKDSLPEVKFKIPQKKGRECIPFDQAIGIARGCLNVNERGWAMAVMLGICTGARLADVCHMQWCNVGPGTVDNPSFWVDKEPLDDNGFPCAPVITYIPRKTASYNKVVRVPVTNELRAHLALEIRHFRNTNGTSPKPYDYLCPELQQSYAKNGNKILSQRFPQLCLQMVLKYYTFHQLRHSFVTIMLGAGVSPAMVAQMTGHSLGQIMTYTHIDDEKLTTEINAAFAQQS